MVKESITWTDYDGQERTEDFYFNLSQAEMVEMNLAIPGGLEKLLNDMITTKDIPKLADYFKTIICKAYGKKSPDGRKFMKSKEILDDFMATEAYSIFYMSLATDAEKASDFINRVLPKLTVVPNAIASAI